MRIRMTRLRNEVMRRKGWRIRMRKLRNEVMRRIGMRIRMRRLTNALELRSQLKILALFPVALKSAERCNLASKVRRSSQLL